MKTKYFIIGAGLSGITLARTLKDDYLIVEKEQEPGGYCRTIHQDGFVWDYAGHFYHFKTERFKQLFEELMPKEELCFGVKDTGIVRKNQYINYPFQTHIHQLEKQDFIDCLYDLFTKEEKENYDSFLDMLYGKFGKSIVEMFLKPYNEKLYAIDLSKLDVEAMGRFFPYADKEAIIRNMKEEETKTYNDTFMYPKQGAYAYIEKLYQGVKKDRVFLNTTVTSIDFDQKTAYLSNGEEVEYEYCINTSPLHQFLNLDQKHTYDSLIKEMSYNKVLVFNLGFDIPAKKYETSHWLYLPEKKYNFYRIGFYNHILQQDRLSMYIEIGFSKDASINVEEELKASLENLIDMGIIDHKESLISHRTIVMDPAYVHISKATQEKVNTTFKKLEKHQVYSIGRYGKWTYCSMEDAMIWAEELGNKLTSKN